MNSMGFLLHSNLFPSSSVAIGAGFGTLLLGSRSQSILAVSFWAYQCCPCMHPCLHAIGTCSHSASFGWMRKHSLLWISCHSASRLGISHSTLDSPLQDVFQIYARPISSCHRRILYTFRIHPTIEHRGLSAMHSGKTSQILRVGECHVKRFFSIIRNIRNPSLIVFSLPTPYFLFFS